ncbi:MAG: citrate synthase [Candidatus Margulisiibacteriota bacterium]|jgi:citrate synthase
MIFEELKDLIVKNNLIDNYYYEQHDVKRGLRHKDGNAVVVGLTNIGEVLGNKKQHGEIVPVDGILKYRGKDIEGIINELGKTLDRFWFEKVTFLLLVGRYPTDSEFSDLLNYLEEKMFLPEITLNIIKTVPGTNLMNKLQLAIASLYGNDSDPDSLDPYQNFIKSLDIIAKLPLILAYSYLSVYKKEPKYLPVPKKLSIAEAFLYLIREGKEVTELEKHLLDLCLVLHAEHGGGNNSTFACKVVTSSGSDIYSALIAAIGSLKGPLHGAANEQVMDMMENIKENVKNWEDKIEISDYLSKIVNKQAYNKLGKIFGLGHAIYTKSDPRAIILKEKAQLLAKEQNRDQEFLLYTLVEELGPKVFKEIKNSDKVIAPNVDFYSGFVYDCLNIPVHVYAPIFAMARVSGWCAHRIEEILSGKRIIRPGYKYIEIIP